MTPFLDDGDLSLYHGDAITVLQSLPSGIAQTCVTSPPYWGLRDYGTGTWTGGDASCDHSVPLGDGGTPPNSDGSPTFRNGTQYTHQKVTGSACRCGAQRVDDQLGLEATPTQYVERIVNVFREVRRVLRDDGTLWLNLGDSYNANQGAGFNAHERTRPHLSGDGIGQKRIDQANRNTTMPRPPGLKPKDLVGIPWRVAFALQADGWYLRSDIIWSKPNPMPESVTDRPTKAHEYLFLFSKQPRYFYDADAIREPHVDPERGANGQHVGSGPDERPEPGVRTGTMLGIDRAGPRAYNPAGRNRRSVWVIPTEPFPEAHFATYPQELVRPCILAGTSERGECAECGAPWRRQVERELEVTRGQAHPDTRRDPMDASSKPGGIGDYQTAYGRYRVETIGWEPSCSCAVSFPTTPQTVLDPFIGSGTTALVARKHGRRCIGIDLSLEYLAIAAKRTRQLSLLGGT